MENILYYFCSDQKFQNFVKAQTVSIFMLTVQILHFRSHLLMLASQGGTPLTFERLLFMFLGDEEHRPTDKDQTLETLLNSVSGLSLF